MSKFAIQEIEAIKGKQLFWQLEINGHKQLDSFENSLKGTTYLSEFRTILSYMTFIADNRTLPQTKFKDITPKKESIKEYEFKSKHLRIYVIHQKNGKIIVMCGFKNEQKKDIARFRALKKQLVSSLNLK